MIGKGRRIRRREFIKFAGLTSAGVVLAGCAQKETPTATSEPMKPTSPPELTSPPEPTSPPAPPEEVTLEVASTQPEYENLERQIWDIFEAENPGIKIQMFSVNEDQEEAHQAKIAGGWYPAMDEETVNQMNYEALVNILETDFPYFDRWTYNVKAAWSDRYGIPGVLPCLNPFQGFVLTWIYHEDLIQEAGIDPRETVKTWDDLKQWLDEGTAWAKSSEKVDRFWDLGWHRAVVPVWFADTFPMAFPDGQRADQQDCWLGKKAFSAPDSPYRHTFEFLKEAYDKGWLPENWWLREWESDMEASFAAKKSAVVLHGPWMWSKAISADPTSKLAGFPATPPATGQSTWMQYMAAPEVDKGFFMYKASQEKPEWPQIMHAFAWWHSPKAVKLRAEAMGSPVLYMLDEPLQLETAEWKGILKDIGGEAFPDVTYETLVTGDAAAAKYANEGAPEPKLWEWPTVYGDVMEDRMTIQDALDWWQDRWEEYYQVS